MSVLGKFNRVMYTPKFSLFDVNCIYLIGMLMDDYSYWWALLLIPCVAVSIRMERLFANEGT
jgi:hypothetical protein